MGYSMFSMAQLLLATAATATPVFKIKLGSTVTSAPVTGRAFLFISKDNATEPRYLVGDDLSTSQFFGVDIDGLTSADDVEVDKDVLGYPLTTLSDVPVPAVYTVQAVIQPYHLYDKRADNHTLWLPRVEVNRFEGGDIFSSPGTFYSTPQTVHLGDSTPSATLVVDHVEAARTPVRISAANDTDYIKHVSVTSALLSAFWGEPVTLEACVLLPWGFKEHPELKYPVFLYHGHYHDDWATPAYFSETCAQQLPWTPCMRHDSHKQILSHSHSLRVASALTVADHRRRGSRDTKRFRPSMRMPSIRTGRARTASSRALGASSSRSSTPTRTTTTRTP